MAIQIITDSTCDLSPEQAAALGVTVVPLRVRFGEREYIDGVELTKAQFYQLLSESRELPTTSQINPDAFEALFRQVVERGDEVLGVFLSGELSGTFQSAVIARELVGAQHIHLVDSGSVTLGLALLLEQAAHLRDEGQSAKQIAVRLEELRGRLSLYAMVDTLKYLKMGGRLSGGAAAIGGLLGIKPIVTALDGKIEAVAKARGKAAALAWIAEKVAGEKMDPALGISFAHSCNPELMHELRDRIEQVCELPSSFAVEIGSVVGTHAGPGCVGIAYFRGE
ncbi:DegV family protein [Feifania hominis]|uniref:DegV family protein n=1 Tax=Feifania hominis TaxID=2763660 RepID=A0A926DDX9_9FIRM|nr:DegV family protein [Feifania hominis]MBC8536034.1 DegV family protein [Feifania hominis]